MHNSIIVVLPQIFHPINFVVDTYLFIYLKTITSELHNSKSMHFSQVTVMYIVGDGTTGTWNWN